MLDAYVIEEIKRRERHRERDERPTVQVPVPELPEQPPPETDRKPSDRGVIVIDLD
jgi:hypothetical protein